MVLQKTAQGVYDETDLFSHGFFRLWLVWEVTHVTAYFLRERVIRESAPSCGGSGAWLPGSCN